MHDRGMGEPSTGTIHANISPFKLLTPPTVVRKQAEQPLWLFNSSSTVP